MKHLFLFVFLGLFSVPMTASDLVLIPTKNFEESKSLFNNPSLRINFYCDEFVVATLDGHLEAPYVWLDQNPWDKGFSYYLVNVDKYVDKEGYIERIKPFADVLYDMGSLLVVRIDEVTHGQLPPAKNDGMVRIFSQKVLLPVQSCYTELSRFSPDPFVESLLAQVNGVNITTDVQHLQNYGTRNCYHASSILAQNWIKNELLDLEFSVEVMDFTMPGGAASDNVIATFPGTKYPDEYVVLGAHYDSYAGAVSNPAPGADDNASGTAGILEIARILSLYDFDRTIIFCAFSGEEYGLYGSKAYAKRCSQQGMNILGYFNMDMNGYLKPGNSTIMTSLIYPQSAKPLGDFYTTVAGVYLPDFVVTPSTFLYGDSDHTAFNQNGFMGIFPFEDAQNYSPYIHSASDVVGTSYIREDQAVIFTKAILASVVTMANMEKPQGLPYSQDFSGFVSKETLPEGWTPDATGSSANRLDFSPWADGGNTNTGLKYSTSQANVLGYQHTSETGVFTASLGLKNDTGEPIEELFISYLGMVAEAGGGRSPVWTVKVNDTEVSALAYSTADGTNNRIYASVQGLNIAGDELFTVSWSSDQGTGSGSSKQIGIGEVNISTFEGWIMIGAADDASNYTTWSNGSNEGYGFEPWNLTAGTDGGYAGFFPGNPAVAGISGMDNPSFGLYANPAGNNYANADRNFISPFGIGATFSFNWGVNWDSDGPGNKGINLYTGGTSGTQLININQGGSATITINGSTMFSNYGTEVMSLNFEYVSDGALRVYGTGRDGSESFNQTFSVAGAPDAVRFYASGLAPGDQRQPFFNNLNISTSPSVIPDEATVFINGRVELNNALEVNNLIIEEGSLLQVNPDGTLTVNGLLNNENTGTKSDAGLLIKSSDSGTGSLIHYTHGVQATAERYISEADWEDGKDGWHLISSPVSDQPIAGSWTPSGMAGDYDFYAWNEANVQYPWLNQKDPSNSITHFIGGQGYLVAYEQALVRTFSEELNVGNVTVALKNSAGDKGRSWEGGWNLLGNPYPSAIDWYKADRSLFEDDFVYVYNTNRIVGELPSPGYESIDGATEGAYLAANQGFFVKAEVLSNNIPFTFSDDMRVHGAGFMKNSETESQITLVLKNTAYADKATIRIWENSSFDRDRRDAVKMFSYSQNVPQIYSMTSDSRNVSINSIPAFDESTLIHISTKVPANGMMTLNLDEVSGEFENHTILLIDQKTSIIHKLSETRSYTFEASTGDDPNRFLLKFEMVSVDENPAAEQTSIYSYGQSIYISSTQRAEALISVFNITGQQVYSRQLMLDGLKQITLNVPTGWYVVQAVTTESAVSRKVFIR
ncbi:MAG: M28 family peptidase [Bacteroidales bacterium]|nr:M28 family peptidase [Bacteroidales bacterium]